MRHKLLLILLLLAAPCLAQQQTADLRIKRQMFFEHFRPAKIIQPFGRFVVDTVNISVRNSGLLFKQDGKIMQADLSRILRVEVDDTLHYMRVDKDRLGLVVGHSGSNYLLCVTQLNRKKYEAETTGGDNLPYLEFPELGGFIELDGDKFNWQVGYPLEQKYFFSLGGVVVDCVESKIKPYIRPEMKLAFKNLMADRWWSWKDRKSLLQLLPYLKDR